ncbi:palmitoyltransferase ZDHHC22 [Hyla sarda]|uniref:palmitoyltransferase ZDHHC22 n=1 Tax=Hyla sarda TaxID=327740 RepID=UPI0024C20F4B|nr:palmitoyltransferase ZDHHC22 [Hyla sarda]
MVLLQLLNLMAPCYFLCLLAVTFSLQLFFFLPGMCEEHSLPLTGLLHGFFFVFFLVNVLGNYFLVIWNSPASGGIHAEMSDKPFCRICNRIMWDQEHHCFFTGTCIGRSNLRSFVLFCLHASCSCFHAVVAGVGYIAHNFSLSFSNPLTLLRLLPLSVTRFFSGSLLSSEMLAVLMLYLWLGVGLACGAFCCHQLLLISRRAVCPRSASHHSHINWTDNMSSVFGKRWLMAIIFPTTKEK